MDNAEQAYVMLRQFIAARAAAPWVAGWFCRLCEEGDAWMGPRRCIERLGGMAAPW